MSLARFRRSARFVAAALLVVSAFGLPHRSGADEICVRPGFEEHDETKHVFAVVEQTGHDDHCAICHWMRWYKPVPSSRAALNRAADSRTSLAFLATFFLRESATDRLPARAPPSELG
jgi:hypothetical protein